MEGPVEVLVRKMRRVVLRRVRWMWIVVCGIAGRGMESWRGWMVVGMSLFGVLVAMFGCFARCRVDGGGGPSARRKGADGLKFYRVELGFGRTLVENFCKVQIIFCTSEFTILACNYLSKVISSGFTTTHVR